MMELDLRWRQRLQSFRKSLDGLDEIIQRGSSRALDRVEVQALIKGFELCYETGWNLMKDWLEYQGLSGMTGSRDAVRRAFAAGLLQDGEVWMDMIQNRNRTAHIYNEVVAHEVRDLVLTRYYSAFRDFADQMAAREAAEDAQ